jgi:thiol-disulfide isomerase/thioredoxin
MNKSDYFRVSAVWFIAAACSIYAQHTAGIGAALAKDGESLVVKQILPDSPAARSNAIQPGDRILQISETGGVPVPTNHLPLEQAVGLIRGAVGTTVRLTIVPIGKEKSHARVVSIVRGELKALSHWGDGRLLATGSIAPNTQWIRLADRKPEQLADFGGQVIVLEFWATWCGTCQEIMSDLQALPQKFRHWQGKVMLITASVDENPELSEKHLRAKGWNRTHNVWIGTDAIKAYALAHRCHR